MTIENYSPNEYNELSFDFILNSYIYLISKTNYDNSLPMDAYHPYISITLGKNYIVKNIEVYKKDAMPFLLDIVNNNH